MNFHSSYNLMKSSNTTSVRVHSSNMFCPGLIMVNDKNPNLIYLSGACRLAAKFDFDARVHFPGNSFIGQAQSREVREPVCGEHDL